MSRITLYYDVVSPWSYVAFSTLTRYSQLWGVPLDLTPINLGYVMKASSNRPPLSVPNKGAYMSREMHRAASHFGVSLRMPALFPFNSLLAQCFLRALQDAEAGDARRAPGQAGRGSAHGASPSLLHSATSHLFSRVWASPPSAKPDLSSPEGLRAELRAWGGLPEGELAALLESAAGKDARQRLNDEAVRLVQEGGAFGAPWIVVRRGKGQGEARGEGGEGGAEGEEAFFGSDRTEAIAEFLGKEYRGPLAGQQQQQQPQSSRL